MVHALVSFPPSLVCTLLNVHRLYNDFTFYLKRLNGKKKNAIQSLQPGFSFKTTIKPKRTLSKFNGKTLHAAAVVVNIFYSLVFSSAKRDFSFSFSKLVQEYQEYILARSIKGFKSLKEETVKFGWNCRSKIPN